MNFNFSAPNINISCNYSESGNVTGRPPNLTAVWSTDPIISIVTFVTGLLFNGALLLLFILDRSLRKPFNIYLINLLLANLLVVLTQYPLDILSNLYSLYWFMGEDVCTLYLYSSWVIEAGIFNAHHLIALNRIWAALHPHSYRAVHSVKTAVICCIVMWIYVHVAVVPGWLMDFLYYRLPVQEFGCQINLAAWPSWGLTMHFLIFYLPHVTMILAFPLILCSKMIRRRTTRIGQVREVTDTNRAHPSSRSVPFNRVLVEVIGEVNKPPEGSNSAATAHADVPKATLSGNRSHPSGRTMTRRSSHGYVLLGMLIVSVTVCWTPVDTYYALSSFVQSFNSPIYYSVATMIFSFQTTLDPILFAMALKSIRTSARRVFCHRSG